MPCPSLSGPARESGIFEYGSGCKARGYGGVVTRTRWPTKHKVQLSTDHGWSIRILDNQPENEAPLESSLGVGMHHPTAEVEPRHHDNGLTSFVEEAWKEQLETTGALSAHTDMTAFATHNNSEIAKHTSTTTTTHDRAGIVQAGENAMAPSKSQHRTRIKYKEPPLSQDASPIAPALSCAAAPEPHQPHQDECSSSSSHSATQDPTNNHPHSDQPHQALLNKLAPASSPSTARYTTENHHPLEQPHQFLLDEIARSNSPSSVRRTTNNSLSHMNERFTSPTEVTREAVSALVPYSSSSSGSEIYLRLIEDSATEMKGKKKGHGRKKQPRRDDEQELVFRGRRSVEPSNVTIDSWRYDQTLGALVSNTSGASYRPTQASRASTQKASKDRQAHRSPGSVVSAMKFEDSAWAKASPPKSTNINNDWTATGNSGWDTGHPPYASQVNTNDKPEFGNKDTSRRAARPFNHNGRVRIEPKIKKPRESPWIKDSLIPKGDPKRHKIRWSSPSRASSFSDSNRTSSGWGTRRKRGQNDEGAEMGDWAGGLGPANIDWDSRSQFRDHQSAAKIESWLTTTVNALQHVEHVKFSNGGTTISFTTSLSGNRELVEQEQGDVAPEYWFHSSIESKAANEFWSEHLNANDSRGHSKRHFVQPVDADDLDNATPLWNNYLDKGHSMLRVLVQPTVTGNDPDESSAERLARQHDKGGVNAAENRKAVEKAKREAQRKRILAKREKAHKFSGTHTPGTAPATSNAIKPGLSMFVRSATKGDVVQLREIYNFYIDNAFVVPETNRLTDDQMLQRWQAIEDAHLPFIVACQRGEVTKGRKGKHNSGEAVVMPDRVVGFAYAADWSDKTCIYRPTVKLEVFVPVEHYRKGIGGCLLDKMMGLLDPRFVERGGYHTVGDELDGIEPSREISNVIVRYSYETGNTDKLSSMSKWLKQQFGFEKVANLQGIAQKFDKQLSLAMLQKTLSATTPTDATAGADREGRSVTTGEQDD